jgi:hypothetical protein
MAEVKNSFLASKMNKDLDDRLVPNDEYRDALNVQVNTAEGSDIGVIHSVLGNELITDYNDFTGAVGLQCIGTYSNVLTDCVYIYLTNNTFSTYNNNASNFIIEYNALSNTNRVLVTGAFLNFSTLYPILGINIIETLLFWTDNNNQPRKINISKANPNSLLVPTYYTVEDQISVAKISPVDAINLFKEYSGEPIEYPSGIINYVLNFDTMPNTYITYTELKNNIASITTNAPHWLEVNDTCTINQIGSTIIKTKTTAVIPTGSTTLYVADTTGMQAGMKVSFAQRNLWGSDATIQSIINSTTIQMSGPSAYPASLGAIIVVESYSPFFGVDLVVTSVVSNNEFTYSAIGSDLPKTAQLPTGTCEIDTVITNQYYNIRNATGTILPSSYVTGTGIRLGYSLSQAITPDTGTPTFINMGDVGSLLTAGTLVKFWSAQVSPTKTRYRFFQGDTSKISIGSTLTGNWLIPQSPPVPYLTVISTTVPFSPNSVVGGGVALAPFSFGFNVLRDVMITTVGQYETAMYNVSVPFLPNGGAIKVANSQTSLSSTVILAYSSATNSNEFKPSAGQFVSGTGIALNTRVTSFTQLQSAPFTGTMIMDTATTALLQIDNILSVNANPYYDQEYAGDEAFLEDKFVRFSYRYKFEDNEYSLIAPFTQVAFIPKQDGYFTYKDGYPSIDDESSAYRSTIVNFMRNKVDNILLQIPLPVPANEVASTCKISAIELLYKDASSLNVNVIDSIIIDNTDAFWVSDETIYNYNYLPKQPFRTLSEKELIRVSDKTPIRAFCQEVSGNRIIYSNYKDKFFYPKTLDFNAGYSNKSTFNPSSIYSSTGAGNVGSSIIEYPNHSIKQNRNYQIGVVLCDKFGRQSGTILSSKKSSVGELGAGALYIPYLKNTSLGDSGVLGWPGYSLKIGFNEKIAPIQPVPLDNWPGLYNGDPTSLEYNPLGWYSYKIVVKQPQQDYYNVYLPGVMAAYPNNKTLELGLTSHTVLINDNINKVPPDLSDVGPAQSQFRSSVVLYPRVNNTLTAPYNKLFFPNGYDYMVSTIANFNELFFSDQQNYIPTSGAIFMANGSSSTATITVTNTAGLFAGMNVIVTGGTGAFQQNTVVTEVNSSTSFTVSLTPTITLSGATIKAEKADPYVGFDNFYNYKSNPTIAKISTSNEIGITARFSTNIPTELPITLQKLAIYETEPIESNLDIYWETSTTGLISELNTAIDSGEPIGKITQVTNWTFLLNENSGVNTDVNTVNFQFRGAAFNILPPDSVNVVVKDGLGDDVSSLFLVYNTSVDKTQWKIKTSSNAYFYYGTNPALRNFTFYITPVVNGINSNQFTFTNNLLSNSNPFFTTFPPIVNGEYSVTVSSIATDGYVTVFTIEGENGANTGQSIINRQNGLQYSISGQDADLFIMDGGILLWRATVTGYYSKYITIRITDAGGAYVERALKVILPSPSNNIVWYDSNGNVIEYPYRLARLGTTVNTGINSPISGTFLVGATDVYIHSASDMDDRTSIFESMTSDARINGGTLQMGVNIDSPDPGYTTGVTGRIFGSYPSQVIVGAAGSSGTWFLNIPTYTMNILPATAHEVKNFFFATTIGVGPYQISGIEGGTTQNKVYLSTPAILYVGQSVSIEGVYSHRGDATDFYGNRIVTAINTTGEYWFTFARVSGTVFSRQLVYSGEVVEIN